MSNLPIYAKDENGTVIFRCNSGNIHVVHDNVSSSFCEEIFYSYSANWRKLSTRSGLTSGGVSGSRCTAGTRA